MDLSQLEVNIDIVDVKDFEVRRTEEYIKSQFEHLRKIANNRKTVFKERNRLKRQNMVNKQNEKKGFLAHQSASKDSHENSTVSKTLPLYNHSIKERQENLRQKFNNKLERIKINLELQAKQELVTIENLYSTRSAQYENKEKHKKTYQKQIHDKNKKKHQKYLTQRQKKMEIEDQIAEKFFENYENQSQVVKKQFERQKEIKQIQLEKEKKYNQSITFIKQKLGEVKQRIEQESIKILQDRHLRDEQTDYFIRQRLINKQQNLENQQHQFEQRQKMIQDKQKKQYQELNFNFIQKFAHQKEKQTQMHERLKIIKKKKDLQLKQKYKRIHEQMERIHEKQENFKQRVIEKIDSQTQNVEKKKLERKEFFKQAGEMSNKIQDEHKRRRVGASKLYDLDRISQKHALFLHLQQEKNSYFDSVQQMAKTERSKKDEYKNVLIDIQQSVDKKTLAKNLKKHGFDKSNQLIQILTEPDDQEDTDI